MRPILTETPGGGIPLCPVPLMSDRALAYLAPLLAECRDLGFGDACHGHPVVFPGVEIAFVFLPEEDGMVVCELFYVRLPLGERATVAFLTACEDGTILQTTNQGHEPVGISRHVLIEHKPGLGLRELHALHCERLARAGGPFAVTRSADELSSLVTAYVSHLDAAGPTAHPGTAHC